VDRLEQPAGEQARQPARVPQIGLHAITGPLRHQPRRHHRTIDPALNEMPEEAETGRSSLRAAAQPGPRRSSRSTASSS